MGAAGRDFHNFNVAFRDNRTCEVVAFTATQIPNIEGRTYPPALAGALYPNGIPIFPESELADLIRKFSVDQVIFAYSDVSHETVMHKASIALAAGADFRLMGPKATLLKSKKRSLRFVRCARGRANPRRHARSWRRSRRWANASSSSVIQCRMAI
jgi:predicted GTPase